MSDEFDQGRRSVEDERRAAMKRQDVRIKLEAELKSNFSKVIVQKLASLNYRTRWEMWSDQLLLIVLPPLDIVKWLGSEANADVRIKSSASNMDRYIVDFTSDYVWTESLKSYCRSEFGNDIDRYGMSEGEIMKMLGRWHQSMLDSIEWRKEQAAKQKRRNGLFGWLK